MDLLLRVSVYYYIKLSIDYNNCHFFNIIILIKKKLTKLELRPINRELYLYHNNKLIIFFYMDNIYIIYTKKNQLKFLGFKDAIIKKYKIKDLSKLF